MIDESFHDTHVPQLIYSYNTRGRIQTPVAHTFLVLGFRNSSSPQFRDLLRTGIVIKSTALLPRGPKFGLLTAAALTPCHWLRGIVGRIPSELAQRILHAATKSIANALLEVLNILQPHHQHHSSSHTSHLNQLLQRDPGEEHTC